MKRKISVKPSAPKTSAFVCLCPAIMLTLLTAGIGRSATPPEPGDAAPDFTLKTLEYKPVELKQLYANKPVVVVVLRGWPGYQCPIAHGNLAISLLPPTLSPRKKHKCSWFIPGRQRT
ncbi:MAG TPA: hypothetical protein VG146_13650 [Verrucomicrobiae bacterium]|nr:hypothetical protein [Verrucomicrobiae bacterium]